jgi:hypothetical protein
MKKKSWIGKITLLRKVYPSEMEGFYFTYYNLMPLFVTFLALVILFYYLINRFDPSFLVLVDASIPPLF